MYDVKQEMYTTVIREMIRHENDVTNHRIMWLLIGQGFIANAFVSGQGKNTSYALMLPLVGILVTLSAFLMLYKSYQARGYLTSLGKKAKKGALPAEHLPLVGWPETRIEGWWRDVWMSPWIGKPGDLLEPWMFLSCIFMFMWLEALLDRTKLSMGVNWLLSVILTAVIFTVFCMVLVWSQGKNSERTE